MTLPSPTEKARLIEPTTLTIQRLLPGTVDRVWAYLTDSDLRRQWLASGLMPSQVDSPFELVWRNDAFASAGDPRPEGFGEEHRMESRVLVFDPPRQLVFSWSGGGQVSFELAPHGEDVLLTVVHQRIAERTGRVMISAGWHMHLDRLRACLAGTEQASFWRGWSRLRDEYDASLPH